MKAIIANDVIAPSGHRHTDPNPVCKNCDAEELRSDWISTALWRGDELVVVRNIPAMVCPNCGEEFVNAQTALGLNQMTDNGFSHEFAADDMIVPVFDYKRCSGRR